MAHIFILALVLFDLYDGDIDLVSLSQACLFGDDNALSLPIPNYTTNGEFINVIEQCFRRVFLMFNLDLDPFLVTNDIEDVEFLGFTIGLWNGFYVPVYNGRRLLASFCYEFDKGCKTQACISKAWTLTIMAASGSEVVFDHMCACLKWYCQYYKDDSDPTIKAYITLGVPTREECFSFFSGAETSRLSEIFDWSVGGINYCDVSKENTIYPPYSRSAEGSIHC